MALKEVSGLSPAWPDRNFYTPNRAGSRLTRTLVAMTMQPHLRKVTAWSRVQPPALGWRRGDPETLSGALCAPRFVISSAEETKWV